MPFEVERQLSQRHQRHLLPRRKEIAECSHSVLPNSECTAGAGAAADGGGLIGHRTKSLSPAVPPIFQYRLQSPLRLAYRRIISIGGWAVVAAPLAWPHSHNRSHRRAADTCAMIVKHHVRAASLLNELCSHAFWW